jgi:acetyl-CoA acetyltransferase
MSIHERTPRARQACLVGVGETRYAKWGGIADASEHALACEAILAAVADAGLSVAEVDGLASFADDRNQGVFLAADLGLPELRFAALTWLPGGGGACAAVASAMMAVEAGQADVVVVYRSLCQGQFYRFGRGTAQGTAAPGFRPATSLLDEQLAFTLPFGLFNAPTAYALQMRRHMHLFGTTSEQMGRVAVAFRAHARHNPRAVMRERPMTLEDHQRSRPVADPFRLFDCCLESDGACAVVVATAERARDLRHPPVGIVAAAQGAPAGYGWGPFVNPNIPDQIYSSGGTAEVARRLWEKAGLGPSDVDVAQIYDHFSGLVILALEDFGFCARGEGGPFVASGALDATSGALPTNTHGGSLSEAYIHGLNHVVEGVRQLRGDSTLPVAGAEVCLVTSAVGVPSSALLLARPGGVGP